MKVGIVGKGIVGGALFNWFKENTKHEVCVYDGPKKIDDNFTGCNAIFLCVPVPTLESRLLDLWLLFESIDRYRNIGAPFFIKSTVLPGTSDYVTYRTGRKVFAMPEFLTERTADSDMTKHPVIVGDQRVHAELLSALFPGKEILHMSNKEAELAKYVHNCFGAMKVNYFNIIKSACNALNANYETVLRGASIAGFIEKTHTQVPGPDGKRGYGGKCLPKDLRSFIGLLERKGVIGVDTLKSTEDNNNKFREILDS